MDIHALRQAFPDGVEVRGLPIVQQLAVQVVRSQVHDLHGQLLRSLTLWASPRGLFPAIAGPVRAHRLVPVHVVGTGFASGVVDDHLRAFGSEIGGNRRADTFRGAGHMGYFILDEALLAFAQVKAPCLAASLFE